MMSTGPIARLSRAKIELDKALEVLDVLDDKSISRYSDCHREFCNAAYVVAEEGIAGRYHENEGD